MKKKKYLPLYKKWMKSGQMECEGLCGWFRNDELFKIIDPDDGKLDYFWGYDGELSDHSHVFSEDLYRGFTPIRQNVMLLMAAMNGEL